MNHSNQENLYQEKKDEILNAAQIKIIFIQSIIFILKPIQICVC